MLYMQIFLPALLVSTASASPIWTPKKPINDCQLGGPCLPRRSLGSALSAPELSPTITITHGTKEAVQQAVDIVTPVSRGSIEHCVTDTHCRGLTIQPSVVDKRHPIDCRDIALQCLSPRGMIAIPTPSNIDKRYIGDCPPGEKHCPFPRSIEGRYVVPAPGPTIKPHCSQNGKICALVERAAKILHKAPLAKTKTTTTTTPTITLTDVPRLPTCAPGSKICPDVATTPLLIREEIVRNPDDVPNLPCRPKRKCVSSIQARAARSTLSSAPVATASISSSPHLVQQCNKFGICTEAAAPNAVVEARAEPSVVQSAPHTPLKCNKKGVCTPQVVAASGGVVKRSSTVSSDKVKIIWGEPIPAPEPTPGCKGKACKRAADLVLHELIDA